MSNVEKAIEAVEKNGMTVKGALKKYKVSLGKYYQAKKAAASKPESLPMGATLAADTTGFDQKADLDRAIREETSREDLRHELKKERLEKLSALYGILSPMTYARAVDDISHASTAELPPPLA